MADEGARASIAFGTNAWTINAVSIQSQGYSRESIETTHHGTTGNYKTFQPADFTDPGTVEVTWLYDPDTQPPNTAAAETITITYPVPTGKNNGATEAFSGFVTDWSPPAAEIDARMEATFTVKKSGAPTFTDAST